MELEDGEVIGYVSVLESGTMQAEADAAAGKMKRKAAKQVFFFTGCYQTCADRQTAHDSTPRTEVPVSGWLIIQYT